MAAVYKMRVDGEDVETHGVMGDVHGRIPLIVDDMLSTGATIEAAIAALRNAGAYGPATVAVTHALFVGDAQDRLRRLPIRRLIVTDTVPIPNEADRHLEIVSVAPLIAAAVRRNHSDESLADLRASA
jgi:ribose-phosphate pyrophosphokinase